MIIRAYSVEWSEEDAEYIATCAEFPLLSGIAKEEDDAIEELKIAIEGAEQVEIQDNSKAALKKEAAEPDEAEDPSVWEHLFSRMTERK